MEELAIGGMSCAACAARIEKRLNRMDGVTATVNYATGRASVSAPAEVTLADITETRVMLECSALRQSIALGDDAWEADLTAAFHRLTRAEEKLAEGNNREQWEERNRIFHEVLIAACPSRWTKHFLSILYHQAERYRHLSLRRSEGTRRLHDEHAALFEAAMARDADTATRLLGEHIRLTLQSVRLDNASTASH